MKKKILFFSPHTAIWVHSLPEAQIARSLSADFQIDTIQCNHDFSDYCVAMSAFGLVQKDEKAKKEAVCIECLRKQEIIREVNSNINYFPIEKFITEEDRFEAKKLSESLTISELLAYKINEIKVGILSQYEIFLQFKKNNFEYSIEEEASGRISFYNTVISFKAAVNYFKENQIHCLIIYNYLYSVNHVWKKVAESFNIPVYFLHAGENLAQRINTLLIGTNQYYRAAIKEYYQALSGLFFYNGKQKENIVNHFRELFAGKHFYAYSSMSSGKDIFQFFNLDSEKKTVLVTMSSYDERFSSTAVGHFEEIKSLCFKTQKDWAESLINFFKNKKEYQVIFRFHPREFPNKRDSLKSKHSSELELLFQNLPENIKINYPSDNISIYEIAMNMACILNAWSSVGEELPLYGIPVLIYDDGLIAYPSELNFLEKDQKKYFLRLEQILKEDAIYYDKLKKAVRWYGIKFQAALPILANFHRYEKSDFVINKRVNIFKRLFIDYKISRLKKQIRLSANEEDDIFDFLTFDLNKRIINRIFKENISFCLNAQTIDRVKASAEELEIRETIESLLQLLLVENKNLESAQHIKKIKNYIS